MPGKKIPLSKHVMHNHISPVGHSVGASLSGAVKSFLNQSLLEILEIFCNRLHLTTGGFAQGITLFIYVCVKLF